MEKHEIKYLARLSRWMLFLAVIVTILDMLKPHKKAPAKVLKHGIEGFRLITIKRLIVDDFDGVVTFHLHNYKTITVALCNVLVVNGGVFVADADFDRQA